MFVEIITYLHDTDFQEKFSKQYTLTLSRNICVELQIYKSLCSLCDENAKQITEIDVMDVCRKLHFQLFQYFMTNSI
jgi:hypothetical protein